MQNLIKFHRLVHKILSKNEILMITKGLNSVVNLQKWMCNKSHVDVLQVNAYANFDQIPLICSQDTEPKPNPHYNQGP